MFPAGIVLRVVWIGLVVVVVDRYVHRKATTLGHRIEVGVIVIDGGPGKHILHHVAGTGIFTTLHHGGDGGIAVISFGTVRAVDDRFGIITHVIEDFLLTGLGLLSVMAPGRTLLLAIGHE